MPRLVFAIKRGIHVALYRWLSKLASTFVLTLVKEKLTSSRGSWLTPLNFLSFSTPISLNILVNRSNSASISLLNVESENRKLEESF